ncbi:unnamed protein product [Dibothriocephalus latus]|uniref:Uncharacterized protein n=1 Tax=Dibothriocephalus latus TaxID=60516 RepID=A0A3P7RKJ7_DIBLA|nr:unnamed protein product [Dibothriocephalus latus]
MPTDRHRNKLLLDDAAVESHGEFFGDGNSGCGYTHTCVRIGTAAPTVADQGRLLQWRTGRAAKQVSEYKGLSRLRKASGADIIQTVGSKPDAEFGVLSRQDEWPWFAHTTTA